MGTSSRAVGKMSDPPEMVPVKSSNVEAIGYDAGGSVMHVRFKGGKTYAHDSVSPRDHQAFMDADSKGKHYHANFKGKHRP